MSYDRPARRHVPRLGRPARTLGLLVLLTAVLTAGAPSVIKLRPGDTLSEIALRHHTSVSVLQALNHMGGSTTIYAGDTLLVPGTAAAPARPAAPATRSSLAAYVVRPGEGLIVIARRYRTTPQRLQAINHLRSTTLLIGQRLLVPVTVRVAPAPAARPAAPSGGSTVVIPGSVARSAAAHRALLAARALPSKAVVRDLIRSAARRHHVPVDLALAVAYQESGFQQRVVSPVDAIGAMQVLPSTARSLGRLHGRTFDLLRASDNVEAGVLLLSDLIRATGSVDKALAGYYQGLGSVGRVGLLPQTKQYIRNVQLLRQRFR
jgi:soluble lytic murein transglycosylase-like protein